MSNEIPHDKDLTMITRDHHEEISGLLGLLEILGFRTLYKLGPRKIGGWTLDEMAEGVLKGVSYDRIAVIHGHGKAIVVASQLGKIDLFVTDYTLPMESPSNDEVTGVLSSFIGEHSSDQAVLRRRKDMVRKIRVASPESIDPVFRTNTTHTGLEFNTFIKANTNVVMDAGWSWRRTLANVKLKGQLFATVFIFIKSGGEVVIVGFPFTKNGMPRYFTGQTTKKMGALI